MMPFNSHVERTLTAAVRLVNALVPGLDGGVEVVAPHGDDLCAAVADATRGEGYDPRPSRREAEELAAHAPAVRRALVLLDAGERLAAAAVVNDLLHATGAHPHLDADPDGVPRLHFHGPDDTFAVGWAAGIAAGLAMAVGADQGGRLGLCDAPGCDRAWVDTSRNGRRRFCSLRCQNRVKTAAYRSRRGAMG